MTPENCVRIVKTVFEKMEIFIETSGEKRYDCISRRKTFPTTEIVSQRHPGLTLLLASWLSSQDVAKFLLHLGSHGSHGKILIKILLR